MTAVGGDGEVSWRQKLEGLKRQIEDLEAKFEAGSGELDESGKEEMLIMQKRALEEINARLYSRLGLLEKENSLLRYKVTELSSSSEFVLMKKQYITLVQQQELMKQYLQKVNCFFQQVTAAIAAGRPGFLFNADELRAIQSYQRGLEGGTVKEAL
ncbi:MAG: hypothetical protein WC371_04655 [Parachlamydiales bacterium]|jgi:hypothetical protein